ncbi:MAG: hypothetical protein LBJ12_08540 [Oscillospiraceae bacterium]|nr:hypothetical protein [Oscillospiraceae bacterium]
MLNTMEYLSAIGMTQLFDTVAPVKKQLKVSAFYFPCLCLHCEPIHVKF